MNVAQNRGEKATQWDSPIKIILLSPPKTLAMPPPYETTESSVFTRKGFQFLHICLCQFFAVRILHTMDQYPMFGFLNRDLDCIFCPRSMFWACRNSGLDGDGHVAQSPKCLIIMAGCIGAVWRPQCPSFLAERRKKSRKVASPWPQHHCLSYLSPNRSWGARQAAGLAAITFLGHFCRAATIDEDGSIHFISRQALSSFQSIQKLDNAF